MSKSKKIEVKDQTDPDVSKTAQTADKPTDPEAQVGAINTSTVVEESSTHDTHPNAYKMEVEKHLQEALAAVDNARSKFADYVSRVLPK